MHELDISDQKGEPTITGFNKPDDFKIFQEGEENLPLNKLDHHPVSSIMKKLLPENDPGNILIADGQEDMKKGLKQLEQFSIQ